MGIYLPNTEIPQTGYITLTIRADGSVVKTRDFAHGTLRIISEQLDNAISADEQDIKKSA